MNENEHLQMIPAERQQYLLDIIKRDKYVNISVLAKELFINEATLRRDLNILQKSGLISRTYGGAVLTEGLDSEVPLFVRETENKEAKAAIGEAAARLVNDGDTLMLDSSSTTMHLIPYLESKKGLKIITNGAKTTILLSKLTDCSVYCTGGILRENSLSFIGNAANDFINSLYVDIAFFSCRGLSFEKGLSDSNEGEAALRRLMIKNSRKSILLLDSTKFNKTNLYKVADTEVINKVITDKIPDQKWQEKLKDKLTIF